MNKPREALLAANLQLFRSYNVPLFSLRVRRAVDLMKGAPMGRLLDIGCADGAIGALFSAPNWQPYGVDISLDNVRTAREKRVPGVVSNFSQGLPFADESFSVVVAMEIIEHVVDTSSTLRECYRVLKGGGWLILTTPNLARLENRVRLLVGRYPHWMDYSCENGIGHVRYYTLPILKSHIRSVGFVVDRVLGNSVFIPPLGRYVREAPDGISSWLGKVVPSLAGNIAIRARKA